MSSIYILIFKNYIENDYTEQSNILDKYFEIEELQISDTTLLVTRTERQYYVEAFERF
jgi:hypothetical protein